MNTGKSKLGVLGLLTATKVIKFNGANPPTVIPSALCALNIKTRNSFRLSIGRKYKLLNLRSS